MAMPMPMSILIPSSLSTPLAEEDDFWEDAEGERGAHTVGNADPTRGVSSTSTSVTPNANGKMWRAKSTGKASNDDDAVDVEASASGGGGGGGGAASFGPRTHTKGLAMDKATRQANLRIVKDMFYHG